LEKKEIYYWSPSLVNIATNQAVIRSAYGISKYGKKFNAHIINFFGEFQKYEEDIIKKNINLINFFNKKIYNLFPRHGYLKSRISFILIYILSFFPLLNLLKKNKPEYLVIHLITSLPLTLLVLFEFKTKFILRISGLPKLGILRRILWKISLNKIHTITCPTESTKKYIISLNLVEKNKIYVLPDPIIDISNISKLKKIEPEIYKNQNFIFAAGRLTKQKNISLMIDAFQKITAENKNLYLLIAGEGEDKNFLKKKVKKLKLEDKIIFLGFSKNIFQYMFKSVCFLSTSLWEDPGFVLIEAGFCRSTVISSNCENGPKEILMNGKSGYLFESNNLESLVSTLKMFFEDKKNNKNIYEKKIKLLNYIKRFTIFRHSLTFNKILLPYKKQS